MAGNPYLDAVTGGSGSGGGHASNPYLSAVGGAAKTSKSTGGVLGLVEHFGSDVKGAVEGIPTGLVETVKHPVRAAQNIGKSYAQMYGPLFRGHFGEFAHNLYAHPLGPVLDALTIATLGGGGVAEAGRVLDSVGAISDTSKLAQLGKAADVGAVASLGRAGHLTVPDFGAGEDIAIKQASRNPVIRARQVTTNKLLNKLPSETPIIGSTARGVRAVTRNPEKAAMRLNGQAQKFNAAFGQLNSAERTVWHLKARGLTPETYKTYLTQQGEKVSPAMLKRLDDPKVAELFTTPTAKLKSALDLGRNLSDNLTGLKVAGGHLDELTAAESPYRHMRIVNGATYEPVKEASPALKSAIADRDRIAAAHENALNQEAAWRQEANSSRLDIPESSNPHRNAVVQLGHALEVAQQHVDKLAGSTVDTGAVRLVDKPGRDIEALAAKHAAAGNEQPFFVRDQSGGKGGSFSRRPSGFAAPASGVKASRGVLLSKGLIDFDKNALGNDYKSFAAQARAQMIHDELVKHAAIIPRGEQIPQGYEELKLNRGSATAPYTIRTGAETEAALSGTSLRDKLSQLSKQEIPSVNSEASHRLIVPTQVRRLIEDNAAKGRGPLSHAASVPTNVWKHLILGLRPAFFGNITIGNSILGTLQMAPGRWGVIGWLNQVLPGFEKIAGPRLTEETMQEIFPEQAYGTFGHSVGFSPNTGLRTAQKAYQGVMPATIHVENTLRRAMAEGWAKASPEVQAAMRRTDGDVNAALVRVAKQHPIVIDDISRRIDDALGNYRTYSRIERGLKAVVPFYGWNRHLTSSVVRLALERPQVLDALLAEGNYGRPLADKIVAGLPGYLAGSVGVHLPSWLGGEPGMKQLLTTTSLNPLNTLVDEAETAKSLVGGKAGSNTGTWPINPFIQAAIEQMTGKSLLTGGTIKGNALVNELEHLTPAEPLIAQAITGRKLSPKATNRNDERAQMLRYLGLPVENVNPDGTPSGKSGNPYLSAVNGG